MRRKGKKEEEKHTRPGRNKDILKKHLNLSVLLQDH